MKNKALQVQQLDRKLVDIVKVSAQLQPPTKGWIRAIRSTIGMSMAQLGKRLELTRQSINDYEKREVTGAITLDKMTALAEAMDMHFIYGVVPKDGSIAGLIDRKATEIAREVVGRTSVSMRLEDQQVTADRQAAAIQERKKEIISKMPKYLWD